MAALLKNADRFAVRALTRDKSSAKAKDLAQRGVEVVQGDLNDKQTLAKAFDGASGLFLVTDFARGAGAKGDVEVQQGKNAVDAAKQAGVSHIVWSSLEDVRKLPGVKDQLSEVEPGHIVSHFESKAEVTEYLKSTGVPYTELLTSIFYQNWTGIFPFAPQGDGSYAFYTNAGDVAHSAQDVNDIGAAAAVIFEDPQKYAGKTVPVVAERITFKQIADAISDVTGKQLKFVNVPDEAAAAAGYPGAADMANMFAYYRSFKHFNELRPLDGTLVKGKSFKQWAEDNKEALTAAFK